MAFYSLHSTCNLVSSVAAAFLHINHSLEADTRGPTDAYRCPLARGCLLASQSEVTALPTHAMDCSECRTVALEGLVSPWLPGSARPASCSSAAAALHLDVCSLRQMTPLLYGCPLLQVWSASTKRRYPSCRRRAPRLPPAPRSV